MPPLSFPAMRLRALDSFGPFLLFSFFIKRPLGRKKGKELTRGREMSAAKEVEGERKKKKV